MVEADAAPTGPDSPVDTASIMRSRQFIGVLVLAVVVGLIASLASWGFLELVALVKTWVWEDLPDAVSYDKAPLWWGLPVLAIAGIIVAFAVQRLPGRGGHIPAEGLNPSPTAPIDLPGVCLAGLAAIGLGAVVGPEAPLIAIGGGIGFFVVGRLRRDTPPELGTLIAAAGTFAGISFLFGSPIIAAVILIEASGGLGGRRMPLVLVPGLLAAGIGSLVSIGMNSWTGVDTSNISLSPLPMPEFARPDLVDFLWTVPFAVAIALGTYVIFRVGKQTVEIVRSRLLIWTPIAGLIIAGCAIAFAELTDKGVEQVLFSGQDSLAPLIADADTWSLSALALLIAFKGLAYGISLGSFRGGPTFPALFLGAAAGLMAAQLPGFAITPAVAVGMGAAVVSVLRLPLSAVVLATLLTSQGGIGAGPVLIFGVAVAYLTTLALPGDPQPDATASVDAAPQTPTG